MVRLHANARYHSLKIRFSPRHAETKENIMLGGQLFLSVLSGVGSLLFSPVQTIIAVIFEPLVLIQFLPLFLSYLGYYP